LKFILIQFGEQFINSNSSLNNNDIINRAVVW